MSCSKKTVKEYDIHPCWEITERAHSVKVRRTFPGNRPGDELEITCSFGVQTGEVSIKCKDDHYCESLHRPLQADQLQALLQTCLLVTDGDLAQEYRQLQSHLRNAGWQKIYADEDCLPKASPAAKRKVTCPLPDVSLISGEDAWI